MKSEKTLFYVLLALIVTLLVWQSRALLYYPNPDSGRWLGDETWRMMTLEGMITTGKPVVREAYASTLQQGVGLMHGSVWIMAAIAGGPSYLLRDLADPITIARYVNFALSLLLLVQIYLLLAGLNVHRLLRLFFLVCVVATETFLIASHTARLDVFVTNYLLAMVHFALWLYRMKNADGLSPIHVFLFGVFGGSGLLIYPHAATLSPLAFLWLLWAITSREKRLQNVVISLAGYATALLTIGLIYYTTTDHFGLFGPRSTRYSQFNNVAETVPALKLFSWSAQKMNIFGRLLQWWQSSWQLILPFAIALMGLIFIRRQRTAMSKDRKIVVGALLLITISTFLVQGAAVYYLIYVIPVAGLLLLLLARPVDDLALSQLGLIGIASVVVSGMHIYYVEAYAMPERSSVVANRVAVEELVDITVRESGGRTPKIIPDMGALQYLLHDDRVRVMTHHFLWFPVSDKSPAEVIRDERVDFLLQYAPQSILVEQANALGVLVAMRTGRFFEGNWRNPDPHADTLRLFRVRR